MPLPESARIALTAIATIILIYSYIPYFLDVAHGKTKPHAFTWFIWGFLTLVGFLGQLAGKGGVGSWVTGFTALTCYSVFILSIFKGERGITRGDWICFMLALACIPLWIITNTPLWSMILVTSIDALGFAPTFRKSYAKPYEETAITFALSAIKFIFAIAALETFSVVTVVYPASLVIMNGTFVAMLYIRRTALRVEA